jgi:hypothetical protein
MKSRQSDWLPIATVKLRNDYRVERSADQFRVRSVTDRDGEYGQLVKEEIVRHLGKTLRGQTVTVNEVERVLLKSGLRLPYRYGYKLHFFAQQSLVTLVACGRASHAKVGNRFEYHVAR